MNAATPITTTALERLGPAERIIETCLRFTEHCFHGRPGLIIADASTPIGVKWRPVSHVVEVKSATGEWVPTKGMSQPDGLELRKVVVAMPDLPQLPAGAKQARKGRKPKGARPPAARIGILAADGRAVADENTGAMVGFYQPPGLFPEACAWLYRQIADVWKVDNEFAGRWASYAYGQDHEDMKLVLCAFMLAQSRVGAPQTENGKLLFFDMNLRDVGRAMMLLTGKGAFNAKMVLRVRKLLGLPEIAAINRELGFAHGPRSFALKGWKRAAREWLTYRDENPKMLDGLVRSGFSGTVRTIAECSEFVASGPAFYRTLHWEQRQADHGMRKVAIGVKLAKAETWDGLDEVAICERIVKEKPAWKRIAGLLPPSGLTRAIVACAIENGAFSDKDLIIATPTLEELGLLEVQEVKARWDKARAAATDQRAAHIARNVTSKSTADALVETSEKAGQKTVEEAVRDFEVFIIVDRSGSMEVSLKLAAELCTRLLPVFPKERVHVSVFNSMGRELQIPHWSAAGVASAFKGLKAEGATDYGQGVKAIAKYAILGENVGADAKRDNLFIFVGDEENYGRATSNAFAEQVEATGLKPLAFGLVKVPGQFQLLGDSVRRTAAVLGIPCFMLDPGAFTDAYAVPRMLRTMIQSTPVQKAESAYVTPKRKTLVQTILDTPLLEVPPGF